MARTKKILLNSVQIKLAAHFGITPEQYAKALADADTEKRTKRRHNRNNRRHNVMKG